MLRSLTTAATGMIAQQNYLDVIANNVANVNTTGFKKVRLEFQDLLSQAARQPGAMLNQGTYQPVGIEIGLGVKTAATTRIFTKGIAVNTDRNLDVMIEGEGFFQVMKEDGTLAYTRDGCFQIDALGQLCTNDGLLVQPAMTFPADTKEITKDLLNKMSSKNLKMNALNWGAGFVTSALFLSTFIPKLQYQITKWRTGSNSFPGTKEFENKEPAK